MVQKRCFVAIPFADETIRKISEVQSWLKRSLSDTRQESALIWVVPENLHLTLKFLGDVSAEQVATIKVGLAEALSQQNAFAIEIKGFGAFPALNRPRVLWLGVIDSLAALPGLHTAVEAIAAEAGIPRDDKRYKPHLTLGRVKKEASLQLTDSRGFSDYPEVGRVAVRSISLFESTLTPKGPIYRELAKFPLIS